MEFNAQIRKQIKAEQKQHVKSHFVRSVGVTILSALPLLLIAMLYSFSVLSPMMEYIERLGADDSAALMYAYSQIMMRYAGLLLLMVVVGAPLTLGLMNFFVELSRGQKPAIGVLFHPFSSIRLIWRSIRMQLCLMLRAFLWVVIPYMICMMVMTMVATPIMLSAAAGKEVGAAAIVLFLLWIVAYIVIILLCSARVSVYNAGYVALHDDNTVGVWQATRQANTVFRGHFKDLIVFYLSFTPWYLILIGIALLAILPVQFSAIAAIPEGAMAGISAAPSAGAVILCVVLMIVYCILSLVLSVYQNASFLAMYEYLAKKPTQEQDQTGPISL